jgi:hypothetical protein
MNELKSSPDIQKIIAYFSDSIPADFDAVEKVKLLKAINAATQKVLTEEYMRARYDEKNMKGSNITDVRRNKFGTIISYRRDGWIKYPEQGALLSLLTMHLNRLNNLEAAQPIMNLDTANSDGVDRLAKLAYDYEHYIDIIADIINGKSLNMYEEGFRAAILALYADESGVMSGLEWEQVAMKCGIASERLNRAVMLFKEVQQLLVPSVPELESDAETEA